MPLYTIKHLKAPWPAGATVGDVIELETVPGWALGKCEPGGSMATVAFASAAEPEIDAQAAEGAAIAQAEAQDKANEDAQVAAALADADAQAAEEKAKAARGKK